MHGRGFGASSKFRRLRFRDIGAGIVIETAPSRSDERWKGRKLSGERAFCARNHPVAGGASVAQTKEVPVRPTMDFRNHATSELTAFVDRLTAAAEKSARAASEDIAAKAKVTIDALRAERAELQKKLQEIDRKVQEQARAHAALEQSYAALEESAAEFDAANAELAASNAVLTTSNAELHTSNAALGKSTPHVPKPRRHVTNWKRCSTRCRSVSTKRSRRPPRRRPARTSGGSTRAARCAIRLSSSSRGRSIACSRFRRASPACRPPTRCWRRS